MYLQVPGLEILAYAGEGLELSRGFLERDPTLNMCGDP